MKVLFIYPKAIFDEVPLGILYLSAILKREGHKTDLFELTPYTRLITRERTIIKQALFEKIRSFRPEIICFSGTSLEFSLNVELSKAIKNFFNVLIIFGGAHPTVDPENTLSEKSIDAICVGEGEYALLELVTKMEYGEDITKIENIWIKEGGKTSKNPVRPLIQDLDSLPYPDRDLISRRYKFSSTTNFITSRGCPYHCSYCINDHLRELYRGKGRFVRYRCIDNVIDEIKIVVKKYGIKKIYFSDETFTSNKKRAIEFCMRYKKEVDLPFHCQTRADTVTRDVFVALKQANCEGVAIGIESGNDFLRNKVLNRNLSREDVLNAFRLAREVGLRTSAFNMVGVPYETEKTIWETINLNKEVQTDYSECSIFIPFKGTKLREICEEGNWIKQEISESFMDYKTCTTTLQELPSISSKKIIAYHRLFESYVTFPTKYYPILNLLKLLWTYAPSNRNVHRSLKIANRMLTKYIGLSEKDV